MNPPDVILQARRLGLRLEPAGDRLAVMPKGACSPEFAALLRQHKAGLLKWLNTCRGWLAVPPENLKQDPAMPRPNANEREMVIGFMLRQGCDRPGPLTAWLVRRECAYFDGPGSTWDCALHAYAAARDAACWQLSRNEADMIQMIQAFHGEPLG